MATERDRTTVRRALRAGGVAGGAVTVALVVAALATAPATAAAALFAGITVAALVGGGWLLLAAILDIVAGEAPGAGRWAWTVMALVVTFLGPFLVLGALTQAAR